MWNRFFHGLKRPYGVRLIRNVILKIYHKICNVIVASVVPDGAKGHLNFSIRSCRYAAVWLLTRYGTCLTLGQSVNSYPSNTLPRLRRPPPCVPTRPCLDNTPGFLTLSQMPVQVGKITFPCHKFVFWSDLNLYSSGCLQEMDWNRQKHTKLPQWQGWVVRSASSSPPFSLYQDKRSVGKQTW